ncbi:MAG: hypothetical protein NTX12_09790 [Actinobacteria bacterium]|nr:hypothetical protein [Actinomycetota bacterium]
MKTLMKDMHPTKSHLIEAVSTYLDGHQGQDPCSDQVLLLSGISKGSMYHHFQDFSELIEMTRIFRFSKYIDHAVDGFKDALNLGGTKADVRQRFLETVKDRQTIDGKRQRSETAHLLSLSIHHRQLGSILAKEQERLTQRYADLYSEFVDRGYANKNFDPRSISVLMQSITWGRIVNDIALVQMKNEDWSLIIMNLLDHTFFGSDKGQSVAE